jgi:hypothetical protein
MMMDEKAMPTTTMRIVSAPSSSRTSESSSRDIVLEWEDVISIVGEPPVIID